MALTFDQSNINTFIKQPQWPRFSSKMAVDDISCNPSLATTVSYLFTIIEKGILETKYKMARQDRTPPPWELDAISIL